MNHAFARRLFVGVGISLVLWLSGCGGGGGDSPPPVTPTGKVTGLAVSSDTSAPIPNAKVSLGMLSTQTAADGSFTLEQIPASSRAVLKIEAAGFVDGLASVEAQDQKATYNISRLVRASSAVTLDPKVAVTITSGISAAQVQLSANSLVNAATGAAASGTVSAQLTPIDPGADPQSMPGDYTASNNERIESFGAVNVTFKDADGSKLNLKAGSTAAIRIPLSSRSTSPPATIPLYYFDENSGLWVEEGSATLKGTGSNRYYEGTVSHFSTWNCDQPQATIYVNGCVNDAANQPLLSATVRSVGLDYSGTASSGVSANGAFRIPVRKGGRATIFADAGNTSNTVVVGPSDIDITLPSCLSVGSAPAAPAIVEQPANVSVHLGGFTYFTVITTGAQPLQYQWVRNGVSIQGATFAYLAVGPASAADNASTYTVRVSNAAGSDVSQPATLTVLPDTAPVITTGPASFSVPAGMQASFFVIATGSPTPTFQWRKNGVNIAGATSASYTTPILALADTGAVYTVVVSNSKGSVTSAPATLTVTPNNTADKVKLMELINLSFNFFEASTASGNLINDADTAFLSPASFCENNGSVSASLGGNPIAGGQAVPLNGVLAASFSNCLQSETRYNGTSSYSYAFSAITPLAQGTSTSTATQMRVSSGPAGSPPGTDFTANGTASSTFSSVKVGSDIDFTLTFSLSSGATLRNELSGLTSTFSSGSMAVKSLTAADDSPKRNRVTYDKLRFAVSGVEYLADGFYELTVGTQGQPGGSGEVIVTSNGTRVGRIFVTAEGVLSIEVDGTMLPLQSREAMSRR